MPGKYLFRREINLSEKNPECALISHYNFPIFHKNPQNFARLRRAQYHFLCRIPLSKCIRKQRPLNKFARLRRVTHSKFRCISQVHFLYEMHKICAPKEYESFYKKLNLNAFTQGVFR